MLSVVHLGPGRIRQKFFGSFCPVHIEKPISSKRVWGIRSGPYCVFRGTLLSLHCKGLWKLSHRWYPPPFFSIAAGNYCEDYRRLTSSLFRPHQISMVSTQSVLVIDSFVVTLAYLYKGLHVSHCTNILCATCRLP
jgi:hypothetical protein